MSTSSPQAGIVAVPTVTKLGPDCVGAVVIGGSHAAVFTTFLTLDAGARAAIQHDASIGRGQAGVGGLAWAEQFGFAMAAVSAKTARIGDGADMLQRGVISAVNSLAAACGVAPGMACSEAADLLRDRAPQPASRPAPMQETRVERALAEGSRPIVMVDSIALAREQDRGGIVASGSHGGLPSAGYASRVGMRLAIFNDAGFCADDSGIACLPLLHDAGIAAVAVSVFSALIGDGRSTFDDGIISAVNGRAAAHGAAIGQRVSDFIREFDGR